MKDQKSKALTGNVGPFWILELKAAVRWEASGNGTDGYDNAAFRDP